MKKSKILVLLTIVALFLAIPAVALAQAPPLARFAGTAMVDDAAAPDGTMVSAMIGDVEVASGTVSGGNYLLTVVQPPGDDFVGASIMFMIGDMMAGESSTWAAGLSEPLHLTAMAVLEGPSIMASLYEIGHSGSSGMATLTEIGEETRVEFSVNPGATMSGAAHIHNGSCGEGLGDIVHDLTSVEDGMSMTMVAASLSSLQDGNHVINVHSASDATVHTVCGAVPDADGMAAMPAMMAGPAGADGAAGEKGDTGNIGPVAAQAPRATLAPPVPRALPVPEALPVLTAPPVLLAPLVLTALKVLPEQPALTEQPERRVLPEQPAAEPSVSSR